jgi:hypothetical protein
MSILDKFGQKTWNRVLCGETEKVCMNECILWTTGGGVGGVQLGSRVGVKLEFMDLEGVSFPVTLNLLERGEWEKDRLEMPAWMGRVLATDGCKGIYCGGRYIRVWDWGLGRGKGCKEDQRGECVLEFSCLGIQNCGFEEKIYLDLFTDDAADANGKACSDKANLSNLIKFSAVVDNLVLTPGSVQLVVYKDLEFVVKLERILIGPNQFEIFDTRDIDLGHPGTVFLLDHTKCFCQKPMARQNPMVQELLLKSLQPKFLDFLKKSLAFSEIFKKNSIVLLPDPSFTDLVEFNFLDKLFANPDVPTHQNFEIRVFRDYDPRVVKFLSRHRASWEN